jgi:hypothetical protein
MSTPIRTDVPVALHPDSLISIGKVLNQENTLGANVYAAAREALATCHEHYAQLEDAEKVVKANAKGTRMVDGRPTLQADYSELAQLAEQRWNKVAPTLDRRMKELTSLQEILHKRVAEAVDDPTRKSPEGLSLAGDIRKYVASLPKAERMRFANDAINAGDRKTIAALLHAPSYLSGLDSGSLYQSSN